MAHHTDPQLLSRVPSDESDPSLLPALLCDTVMQANPAQAYLLSLNSARSRQTMSSFLKIVSRMLGAVSLADCNWWALRRHHVLALVEMLRDAGRAVATVNTYLSALKGVAGEAWMLKQMDVENYQHIRAVRQVRGSALPRGRALAREEIRALFSACEAETGSIGVRDAALLAVILGCGLRRSEAVALSYEDIRLADRALRVLGKGNKERLAMSRMVPGSGCSSGWTRCVVRGRERCFRGSAATMW